MFIRNYIIDNILKMRKKLTLLFNEKNNLKIRINFLKFKRKAKELHRKIFLRVLVVFLKYYCSFFEKYPK